MLRQRRNGSSDRRRSSSSAPAATPARRGPAASPAARAAANPAAPSTSSSARTGSTSALGCGRRSSRTVSPSCGVTPSRRAQVHDVARAVRRAVDDYAPVVVDRLGGALDRPVCQLEADPPAEGGAPGPVRVRRRPPRRPGTGCAGPPAAGCRGRSWSRRAAATTTPAGPAAAPRASSSRSGRCPARPHHQQHSRPPRRAARRPSPPRRGRRWATSATASRPQRSRTASATARPPDSGSQPQRATGSVGRSSTEKVRPARGGEVHCRSSRPRPAVCRSATTTSPAGSPASARSRTTSVRRPGLLQHLDPPPLRLEGARQRAGSERGPGQVRECRVAVHGLQCPR